MGVCVHMPAARTSDLGERLGGRCGETAETTLFTVCKAEAERKQVRRAPDSADAVGQRMQS
eukprot:7259436-Prymnesium_polylepis.1